MWRYGIGADEELFDAACELAYVDRREFDREAGEYVQHVRLIKLTKLMRRP
jgi:hypothetical protein